MKNIICPVSKERILEVQPRITALFVVITLFTYLFTQWWAILLFVVIDFVLRGFFEGRLSLLGALSRQVSRRYFYGSAKIDKAPKVFAARLGVVFSALALVLAILGVPLAAGVVVAFLVLFATVECVLNFCIGCVVYTFLVLPYYR